MNSVSLIEQPDGPPERRASLVQYFQGRPRTEFVVYGLYFLGLADRTALFAEIKDPSYVTSVGWILGITQIHDGRYEDANSWFQICMESAANIPPRYWVSAILGRWKGAGCTLAELEHRKIR